MRILIFFYKGFRKIKSLVKLPFYNFCAKILLKFNGVQIPKKINVRGFLKIMVSRNGKFTLGNDCSINSGNNHNLIGRQQKTIFWVDGDLTIGNNVGISSTAIICNHSIEIEDNVKIGGNTVIYDTDFHSLDVNLRKDKKEDKKNAKCEKVIIKKNVFIGAHSTILKGVTIGENSIIGSCSLVSKNIPNDEIWGGNPIRFIKKI